MKKTVIIFITIIFLLCLCACKKDKEEVIEPISEPVEQEIIPETKDEEPVEETDEQIEETSEEYTITVLDEGTIIYSPGSDYGYLYGPSIIKNDDGSYDAWFSSPGNSGSQWDWISYKHSDDGIAWSDSEIVLKPTTGSKDQCSVCDPAVIHFGDYYYLGYTATDYYEGKGTYNMAFVARSLYPDGPYEKWNGTGWGGNPEPLIFYDGGKDNWGIGELSFVIYDGDLCIFYSYIDIRDSYIGLYKANLSEDWPGTMRSKGPVLYRLDHDSVDIAYDDNLNTFLAFTIYGRLTEGSQLNIYASSNGKWFEEAGSVKENIENFAHNLGVARNNDGHINSDEDILIGYAYGENWGRWKTKIQTINIGIN